MTIREESPALLAEHGRVPIAFTVDRVLDLEPVDRGLGGLRLRERRLDPPYVKDYDAIPGSRPEDWARRFDVSTWGLLSAWMDGRRAGGAVVAFGTPGLDLAAGRSDLAVVWDLRVAPDVRRRGIGSSLFAAAERWARSRGCRQLAVETQNVNVAACRFYAARGCELGAVHRFAYPDLPEEVQLIWYKTIQPAGSQGP